MHPPSKSMAHLPAPLQAYPIVLFEYIKSSSVANERLSHIRDGMTVAIDIEWKQPATDGDSEAGTTKKTKGQKNQLLRSQVATLSDFEIDWDEVKTRIIQICALDGVLYVLDILSMKCIPTELSRICKARLIPKISVGIINDVQRLWKDFRLDVTPAIELGLLAKLARPEVFHPRTQYACLAGLADITLQVLGRILDKGPQNSDWSAEPLSDRQLLYAATDAHATLTTYLVIREEIDRSRQAVPSLWYAFDSVQGTRVRMESKDKWRTECPWYSKEPGIGFLARTYIN
ncbi:ribonuclease H-like domain-containing protein [Mycena leptocephala]|nr:ribonuclease H-like domain-containing protein [Mycena leptocephala]